MKLRRFLLVVALSAVAGLALGFVLRGSGRSHSAAGGERLARSVGEKDRASAANPGPPATNAFSIAQFEKDLQFSHGVTQWLYWMQALEEAALADMPRLARLAEGKPDVLQMVAKRWIELNPRHFFDALVHSHTGDTAWVNGLGYTLLDAWCKADPAAVISALEETPPFGARGRWRSHIAGNVMRSDPELGLQLMEKWREDHYTPSMSGVESWAAADPRHAAEFTFAHHAGDAAKAAAQTIGQQWAKVDPAAALAFALGRAGELPELLAGATLKSWAERNLDEAADWLAQADSGTRNRLGARFVEAWATRDPANALAWSEANLTGSALALANGGILKSAAEKDVGAAARLVGVMQPSAARTAGAVAVAEKWLPDSSSQVGARPEVLAWVRGLDDESIRRVVEKTVWQWGQADPRGLAEFLATTPVKNVEANVYANVARGWARSDPRGAINWADTLPDHARPEAGGEAFSEWNRSQPETSGQWWSELSHADPRRMAYLEHALRNLAWDPTALAQFGTLAAHDPATAKKVVAKLGLSRERQSALLRTLE